MTYLGLLFFYSLGILASAFVLPDVDVRTGYAAIFGFGCACILHWAVCGDERP